VEWRIKFKIATLTFKALETGQSPYHYLAQQLCPYAPTRALRSSTSKLFPVPRTNLQFGLHPFSVSARGTENAGRENAGHEIAGHKRAGYETDS